MHKILEKTRGKMYIYTQHYKGVLVMSWLFPNYSRKNVSAQ